MKTHMDTATHFLPSGDATALAAPLPRPAAMVYLQPGTLMAFAEPAHITTVLGAGVSICLYHPHRGVGGMSHFLRPRAVGAESRSARAAEPAFEQLLAVLRMLGAAPSGLYAKLFGGAGRGRGDDAPLGQRNVEAARTLLDHHAIPLVAEDVGGTQGRKLLFETCGGAAWVRRLTG
jgi:chemotaxis protein CheD